MQFDEAKAVSCLHEKPLEDSLNYRAQPARRSDACVAAVTRMAIPRERIGRSLSSIIREWSYPRSFPNVMY